MSVPAWLVELHCQWHKARGKKLAGCSGPFPRRWEDLLDAANLLSAAERNAARAEAEALGKEGRIVLLHHQYRKHNLVSISLPPSSESWLLALVGETSAHDLRGQAIARVRNSQAAAHPRWPESWQHLCDRILSAFEDGRNLPPFFWNAPEDLGWLVTALHGLTARAWPPGTLIREVSTELGFPSKLLEEKQRVLEAGLEVLFGEETTLESLGLAGSESHATVHGRLILHFPDGGIQPLDQLQGPFTLSLADLRRATHATTDAGQILSIENVKTTFRQAAAANLRGDTLLIATSYPNAATKRLLEILPADLPHHHFGDTDASGYAILRSLRELGHRPVAAFQMRWQDNNDSAPLSEHDRRLLPSLKSSPLLNDCLAFLVAMENANRKGLYEQEALGGPTLTSWPFWNLGLPNVPPSH